jgi:hypothetical protein
MEEEEVIMHILLDKVISLYRIKTIKKKKEKV